MNVLLPLPFALPLAGGALSLLVRRSAGLLRALSMAVLAGLVAVAVAVAAAVEAALAETA